MEKKEKFMARETRFTGNDFMLEACPPLFVFFLFKQTANAVLFSFISGRAAYLLFYMLSYFTFRRNC